MAVQYASPSALQLFEAPLRDRSQRSSTCVYKGKKYHIRYVIIYPTVPTYVAARMRGRLRRQRSERVPLFAVKLLKRRVGGTSFCALGTLFRTGSQEDGEGAAQFHMELCPL